MTNLKLKVGKMSCKHCVMSITNALKEEKGISDVQIDLASKTVEVSYNETLINPKKIEEIIIETGYEILPN